LLEKETDPQTGSECTVLAFPAGCKFLCLRRGFFFISGGIYFGRCVEEAVMYRAVFGYVWRGTALAWRLLLWPRSVGPSGRVWPDEGPIQQPVMQLSALPTLYETIIIKHFCYAVLESQNSLWKLILKTKIKWGCLKIFFEFCNIGNKSELIRRLVSGMSICSLLIALYYCNFCNIILFCILSIFQ